MVYVPTNWQDGITPVNAANLNKLEQGLAASVGIPADVVVASGSHLIRNRFAGGDTQPAFRLLAEGKMEWGAGGAAAADISIYRYQAGLLKVDGQVWFTGSPTVAALRLDAAAGGNSFAAGYSTDAQRRFMLAGDGSITWGDGVNARDTTLYRLAAGQLYTGGYMVAASFRSSPLTSEVAYHSYPPSSANYVLYHSIQGEANPRFTIDGNGTLSWGKGAGTAQDIGLQRVDGPALYLNGSFNATVAMTSGSFYLNDAGWFVNAGGRHEWGPGDWTRDTNLYRSAAGTLRTDTSLLVGANAGIHWGTAGQLTIGDIGGGLAGFILGLANDTNLYRSAAGVLKTDGSFQTQGDLVERIGQTSQIALSDSSGRPIIYFGNTADTYLYRSAAGVLTTNGQVEVGATGIKFSNGSVQTVAAAGGATVLRKSTAKLVDNTSAATDLLNGEITLPALAANSVVRLTVAGDWLNNTGSPRNMPRFQVALGGTVVLDTNVPSTQENSSATRLPWFFEIWIRMLGSTSAQMVTMQGWIDHVGLNAGSSQAAFVTGVGRYTQKQEGLEAVVRGANVAGAVDMSASKALQFNVINGWNATYDSRLLSAVVEVF